MIKNLLVYTACDEYGEYTLFFNGEDNSFISGYDGNDLNWHGYIGSLIEDLGVKVERIDLDYIFDTEEEIKAFLKDYHGY